MTEQEKFEETIRGKWSTSRRGDKSNEYVALLAQTAWEGWQAAMASREQWHPIETAPLGEDVLVFKNGFITQDYRSKYPNNWTHWMPLPPPPKE